MKDGMFVKQEGYGRFCASFRLKHVVIELSFPSWQFWGIKQKQSTKTEGKFIFQGKGETFDTFCHLHLPDRSIFQCVRSRTCGSTIYTLIIHIEKHADKSMGVFSL